MEDAAYAIALMTVLVFPPAFLAWFVIHPLAPMWRKVGSVGTYIIVGIFVLTGMGVIYCVREPLLRIRFGVRTPLVVASGVCIVVALYLRVRLRSRFSMARLLGLYEIAPDKDAGRLVTDGIYARIRHPRYVEGGFVLASLALLTNYLTVYVLLAAYVPVIYLVVILEERELRARFGPAYDAYCRRVPRFLPRWPTRAEHNTKTE
jgi:protein-S-isoprenylcysteine O-methyltransferase Ste14